MDHQEIKEMIIFGSIALVAVGLAVCGLFLFDVSACRRQAALMGKDFHHGVVEGCLIKVGDNWAPISNYRLFERHWSGKTN